MRLLDVVAELLDTAGAGTVTDPDDLLTGAELWPIFTGYQPSTPDRCLTVLGPYGGAEASFRHPWREEDVQVRVRVAQGDSFDVAADQALAVFRALHGVGSVRVGDEWVSSVIGKQAGPVALGRDSQDRHEHTVNVRVDHQPA